MKKILFLLCGVLLITSCNSYQRKESKRVKQLGRTLIKTQEGNQETEAYTYSFDANGVYCDDYTEDWSGQVIDNAEHYAISAPLVVNEGSVNLKSANKQPSEYLSFQNFSLWDIFPCNGKYIVIAKKELAENINDDYVSYSVGYLVRRGSVDITELTHLVVEKNFNTKQQGHIFATFYGSLCLNAVAWSDYSPKFQELQNKIGVDYINAWGEMYLEEMKCVSDLWYARDPSSYSVKVDLSKYCSDFEIPQDGEVSFYVDADGSTCTWKDFQNDAFIYSKIPNIQEQIDRNWTSHLKRQCIDYTDILEEYDSNHIKAAKKYEGTRVKIKLPLENCNLYNGEYHIKADFNMLKYYISKIFIVSTDERFAEFDYPHIVYLEGTFNVRDNGAGWKHAYLTDVNLLVW